MSTYHNKFTQIAHNFTEYGSTFIKHLGIMPHNTLSIIMTSDRASSNGVNHKNWQK
jgi:hypothetical protein